ncbi:MAG TPA: DNA-binding response regulator [Pseudohongiella sp.]|nr:DNA-binding response regulator [Pseudohongiella sp.]HBX37199.1 DNA-binding response regulator [Pseudohongiella sp.]|tara:strand:+ start:21200 stop:21919 length:720 start_codon:yes stop_codon:yes gene_type:complete
MKIAVVEDSRLARQELCSLLAAYPAHSVVGEAHSVRSGIDLVEAERPDLLLLDIQLPDGDGFSILEQLSYVPLVVFTTAYDEYAVRAFKVSALDYLLKPIVATSLTSALEKAQVRFDSNESQLQPASSNHQRNHIFFREGDRYHFVRMRDISLLEVDGNYTRIYYQDGHAMMPHSLSYLDGRLDDSVFFRVSRQHIVNLDYVASIEPWIGDGLLIKLTNGSDVEVSRRQAAALRQRLSL